MPRRRAAPRLYLDGKRRQWIIRDGSNFIRTGCAEPDRHGAETRLAAYLGQKHRPQRSSAPLIADILMTDASEQVPGRVCFGILPKSGGNCHKGLWEALDFRPVAPSSIKKAAQW